MDMQFGLGLKLALGGFLKKLRFDKTKDPARNEPMQKYIFVASCEK